MAHNNDNANSISIGIYSSDMDFFKGEQDRLLKLYNLEYRNYPDGDWGGLNKLFSIHQNWAEI